MKSNKKRAIEMTPKQFLALLKAVYLGNWMANARRDEDEIKEYEDAEDLVFSHAARFGFDELVNHEPSDGDKYFPTREFEEKSGIYELVQEYEDDTLWDELCERLGERDFHRKYSDEEIGNMDREEYFVKLQECIIAWEIEAEEKGIERLEIVEKSPYYPQNEKLEQ